ncbi:MAG: capsule assembly Wzi family protein [Longimicrobiales bacterium]
MVALSIYRLVCLPMSSRPLWLFLAWFAAATPVAAQAPLFLSSDHWTRSALQRLAITGAVDVAAAGLSWPASRAEVADWLAAAQERDDPRAHMFQHLFAREHRPERRLYSRFSLGAQTQYDQVRAGTMLDVNNGYEYPGPVLVPDDRSAFLLGELHARLFGPFAFGLQSTARADDVQLDAGYLSARIGPVDAWAGRRTLAFGNAPGESLVLNETTTFDGAGISARRGVRLPLAGRVYPELMVARLPRSGTVLHPWFHAMRLTVAPSSSWAIGFNRAAIFGGEGHINVTPGRVLLMLVGLPDVAGKDSDFENQVASVDFLWRTRLGTWPLGVHGELGADDSGWAFLRVPGLVAGVEIGALPALPALALGVEFTHIARRCCTYPPWYQHGALADGWTERGTLLGHPLAGAGSELALYGRADLSHAPLLLAGRFYVRDRAAENLLAPLRLGRSVGGRFSLLAPWRRTQFELRADVEFGSRRWQTSHFSAAASLFL